MRHPYHRVARKRGVPIVVQVPFGNNPGGPFAPAHTIVFMDDSPLRGVSNARRAMASNNREYHVKGPSLAPGHPFVGANEIIAARLGALLNLPMLSYTVLELNGALFFATEWVATGYFDFMTRELLAQCQNRERVYDLVVFDAWLINTDRHARNLTARRIRERQSQSYIQMIFGDHSHALLPPPRRPFHFVALVREPANRMMIIPFIRASIEDHSELSAAIAQIEAIPDDSIRTCVLMTPDSWLSSADKSLVTEFLINRRDALRASFNAQPWLCPALVKGGPL